MPAFAYTSGNPANLTGGANASMADIQGPFTDLATFLNTRIAAIPSLRSDAPSLWGTTDGSEVYYLADATNGIVWHFRYRAASASAFKWEAVGAQQALLGRVDASQTISVTLGTWGDLATVGPDVTVPLAGDYDLTFGANLTVGANGQVISAGIAKGAGTTPVGNIIQTQAATATVGAADSMVERFTALTAGLLLRMRYQPSSVAGGTPQAFMRWLKVQPIRVG